jgi:hypothetical protein
MDVLLRKMMDVTPRSEIPDLKYFAMLLVDWIRKHRIPRDEQPVFRAQEGKWFQRMQMDLEAKVSPALVTKFLTKEMFETALASV